VPEAFQFILVQCNTHVGDFEGNVALCRAAIEDAQAQFDKPVLVFPELAITGYPPEDLLLRPSIGPRVDTALASLCASVTHAYVILGYPRKVGNTLYNAAGVLHEGRIVAEYFKWSLPNYQVFDEKRYFTAGSDACVVDIHGTRVGVTVCEDIWNPEPAAAATRAGAQVLVNLNASPFHRNKQAERHETVRARILETGLPIVYVNQVGGQDELVFDGGSFAMDANGDLVVALDRFKPEIASAPFPFEPARPALVESGELISGFSKDQLAEVWDALVLGVRDYVQKNGFPGVVLGLSGGVDSALTLAVAEAALGADKVQAVMMPFRYTSQMSLDDAAEQAHLLGVKYSVLPIESIYTSFMGVLEDEFTGKAPDTTEENLQARARGVLLMSISNKTGKLVLTTGNKSEIAVGYSTLYGDMAGGFNVLKDVPKTLVFALCWYRNSLGPCIPERVITRPPSAELRPDQKDEDSLPAYEVLDQIIDLYVEQDLSAKDIIARGFNEHDVLRTIRLIDLNEYKRRQAPVGVRLTKRGFGRDRRYPITSRWRAGV
jgi:NAD+ synthase (glutamine-hydrolysing)